MLALDPKNSPLSTLSCKMMLSLQEVLSTNFKLTCTLTQPELEIQIMRLLTVIWLQRRSECRATIPRYEFQENIHPNSLGELLL